MAMPIKVKRAANHEDDYPKAVVFVVREGHLFLMDRNNTAAEHTVAAYAPGSWVGVYMYEPDSAPA